MLSLKITGYTANIAYWSITPQEKTCSALLILQLWESSRPYFPAPNDSKNRQSILADCWKILVFSRNDSHRKSPWKFPFKIFWRLSPINFTAVKFDQITIRISLHDAAQCRFLLHQAINPFNRVKLYAAAVKRKIQLILARPTWRSFLINPISFIQPKHSSIRFLFTWLIL